MKKVISAICAAVITLTGVATSGPVIAAPIQPIKLEYGSADVQQVQYRDGGRARHYGPRVNHRGGFHRYGGRPYYNGHRGYRYAHPGWRRYNGWWFPPAAFVAGAIVGGAIANQPAPVYQAPRAGSAHVQWCSNRYRSYRASDNTFQPNNGPRKQCNSPYS